METVHWEMAAKFYLMVDGIEDRWLDLRAFVGPNLVDRLGDKLDHIVRRQLPLGRTAEAKAALGHAIDRSEVYLLGWLFYRDGVTPPGLDVLGIAPITSVAGGPRWMPGWAVRPAGRSGGGAARWCRLQRADWLSGARVRRPKPNQRKCFMRC
jgi:hypothetical protein